MIKTEIIEKMTYYCDVCENEITTSIYTCDICNKTLCGLCANQYIYDNHKNDFTMGVMICCNSCDNIKDFYITSIKETNKIYHHLKNAAIDAIKAKWRNESLYATKTSK